MDPVVTRPAELRAFRLYPGATNKLALILAPGPDVLGISVVCEIWDVGGRQGLNSHPTSTETFFFLQGEGLAHCDGTTSVVRAGDFLVLPAGSQHYIENTGTGRMYAITTLVPEDGSHTGGDLEPAELDDEDLSVLRRLAAAG
jgi:mannose-6-phosphate isomerase-like protein (cupin superfamily)